jgi:hypothetical protein
MRKLILLWLFIPLTGMSQQKNVINATRYFPKIDKVAEFEKALAAHAQKYHSGDWKWRVYEIESGPDAGGYHITEGPMSWDDVDHRGNLGADHMADWNKNVAIYLTDKFESSYAVFQDSLSSVKMTAYADKINITHLFPKIGWGGKVEDLLKTLKKVWVSDGESVAVYASSSSGPGQYSIVTRYTQGLKEREANFRKPFRERYEGVNGQYAYTNYLDNVREYYNDVWSELLFYRADLSPK